MANVTVGFMTGITSLDCVVCRCSLIGLVHWSPRSVNCVGHPITLAGGICLSGRIEQWMRFAGYETQSLLGARKARYNINDKIMMIIIMTIINKYN